MLIELLCRSPEHSRFPRRSWRCRLTRPRTSLPIPGKAADRERPSARTARRPTCPSLQAGLARWHYANRVRAARTDREADPVDSAPSLPPRAISRHPRPRGQGSSQGGADTASAARARCGRRRQGGRGRIPRHRSQQPTKSQPPTLGAPAETRVHDRRAYMPEVPWAHEDPGRDREARRHT